jgi:hypothetical protein
MLVFQGNPSVEYAKGFLEKEEKLKEQSRLDDINSRIEHLKGFSDDIHAQTELARQYFRLDNTDTKLHVQTIYNALEKNNDTYAYLLSLDTLMDLMIDVKEIEFTNGISPDITPYLDAFSDISIRLSETDFKYSIDEIFVLDKLSDITNKFWIFFLDPNDPNSQEIQRTDELTLNDLKDSKGREIDLIFRNNVLLQVVSLLFPKLDKSYSLDLQLPIKKLYALSHALNLYKNHELFTPDSPSFSKDLVLEHLCQMLNHYAHSVSDSHLDPKKSFQILVNFAKFEHNLSEVFGVDFSRYKDAITGFNPYVGDKFTLHILKTADYQTPEDIFTQVYLGMHKQFYSTLLGPERYASANIDSQEFKYSCLSRMLLHLSQTLDNAQIGFISEQGLRISYAFLTNLKSASYLTYDQNLHTLVKNTLITTLEKEIESKSLQPDHVDYIKEQFLFHLGGTGLPIKWNQGSQ